MFMSFGVSAMSCSRGVGMPPHRSSTALRSVMPALPRPGGRASRARPPRRARPRARPPGAASPGRRPAAARSRCRSQSADEAAAASSQGKSAADGLFPRADGAEQVAALGARRRDGAPRGDRRSSRAVVSPPFPTALGRSPRCGETRSRGLPACSPLGDGITRLDTPEMPDGTSMSGTVSAPFSPRRRFSLRSRAESGARELGAQTFRLSSRAPRFWC